MTKKKPNRKGGGKPKKAASKRGSRVNYRLIGGTAVVLAAAAWLFYPTYQLRIQQQEQLAAVKREYKRLRAENDTLRARIKQIKSPEYVERYAREKLGLVKPGENAYVVLPPSTSKPATTTPKLAKKPPAPKKPPGAWESVKTFFLGLFGR